MKKRFYIFYSLLSILLWAWAEFYFISAQTKLKPQSMIEVVQQDIYDQQQALKDLFNNKRLMTDLWKNQLSESEFQFLAKQKFTIQLYENARLSFWNRNDFPVTETRYLPGIRAIKEGRNVFLYQSYGKDGFPNKRMNIILPIFKHYEVSNDYLQSGFSASKLIPESSIVSISRIPGTTLVSAKEKTPLFYISVFSDDIKPYKPDLSLLLLIIAALISTVMAVQLIGIYLSRNFSVWIGIGFVFLFILSSRVLVYFFDLPFNLENLELFSPQVFASNNFLPSFGHLFLHVLGIYWLLSFIISKRIRYDHIKCKDKRSIKCWAIFGLTIIAIFTFGCYLKYLLKSIVFDSDISFDTNTFNAMDKFTLLALVIIVIIARILLRSLQLANIILNNTIANRKAKYIGLFLGLFLLLLLDKLFFYSDKNYQHYNWLDITAALWAIVYIYMIDNKYFKNFFSSSGLFSLIFLSVYFSIICAAYFKFFIDEKEQNISRIAFAEKLTRQQDTEMEMKFEEIEKRIQQDSVIQQWVQSTEAMSGMEVYKHFKLFNSDLYFTKYAQDIFLFDKWGHSLLKNENMPFDSLLALKKISTPTLSQSLFFRIDSSQQGAYLVFMPITKNGQHTPLGYLGINFKLKQNIGQSLYPRLLKNESTHESRHEQHYNYAIYINGKLANQYGNYNFSSTTGWNPNNKSITYSNKDNYSELYYKAGPNMVYVVVYENNVWVGIITIFSFLFGLFLIVSIMESWFTTIASTWASGRKIRIIYNVSMSVRVKYFALGFTAISFFIIGLSTVIFLTNRYQASSLSAIEEDLGNTSEAIEEYLQNEKSLYSDLNLRQQMANNDFAFFLNNIAQQQKMDINLFDINGKLAFTTQNNIYKTNVLDYNMAAHAFYTIKRKKLSNYIEPESIGSLDYTAGYAPILNHDNKLIGYLNIPSFYTKQHLDNQIISLITTLVNIYTILLLLSSIITFLFINSLTKSLRLVADSLKNVSLKNNELISWPYRDEIGLLIKEYNKMVATVEKNARSLVLDERQNAWREMAQQVAHEIKNPLTPMKLNIQYLQQAINSNHPDIINLTKRVSSSIIEQIDNLNYIASEFSNFAKMPENKTERIDVKSTLERIILLFAGNKNLTITHSFPTEPVVVFADKSQMLRIFTNIIQNAVESIPTEEWHGTVDVQITVAPENNTVLIKVKDNGTGIPDEVKDRIFDPYFTTKTSGTGLGLAMTKKIIELWGGTIKFESEEGKGTTFMLTIPLG